MFSNTLHIEIEIKTIFVKGFETLSTKHNFLSTDLINSILNVILVNGVKMLSTVHNLSTSTE